MEDIECDGGLIERADAVDNPTRDAPDITGAKQSSNASHRELEAPLEQIAHLLVGMRMFEDNRFWLEPNNREHQVQTGVRPELDTREDQVPRA
jgi:hypothetical protein